MTESVILCEGYHDRAFWAGLLLSSGCSDPGIKPGLPGRFPVFDLENKEVVGGHHYYVTPGDNRVRVVPCHGKSRIPASFRKYLNQRNTRPFACLVINVDADTNTDGTPNITSPLTQIAIENLVKAADTNYHKTPAGTFRIDTASIPAEIAMICWGADDPPSPGLPNQQTLERLVCAAICAVHPERSQNVADWLELRHSPPPVGVKEYAHSMMAGWYAEHGCDDFYRCLWDENLVCEALIQRLETSGAWAIAQSLAS